MFLIKIGYGVANTFTDGTQTTLNKNNWTFAIFSLQSLNILKDYYIKTLTFFVEMTPRMNSTFGRRRGIFSIWIVGFTTGNIWNFRVTFYLSVKL